MRHLTQATLCLLALVVVGFAGAATLYVDDDAPNDPGPGDPTVSDPNEDGSTDHPYDAIQEATDDASTGDEVLVAAGTYTGEGNACLDFDGKDIALRSFEGPGMTLVDLEGGNGFYFHSGETSFCELDGFSIRNGQWGTGGGGGVRCVDSSPSISNCLIWSCGAPGLGYGGGIELVNSSAAVTGCVIWSCAAQFGGGLACRGGGDPTITNCLLWSNATSPHGTEPDGGGGMYSMGSSPLIVNCTISGNSCEFYGGGFFCDFGSDALVINSIVWGNATSAQRPWLGYEIAVDGEGTELTLSYSDVPLDINAPPDPSSIYVSEVSDVYYDTGFISLDPLFVAGPLHDYYLSQTAAGQDDESPCVDSGIDLAVEDYPWLFDLTTRTDSRLDSDGLGVMDIDMGYHSPVYIEITDVYWDQSDTQVSITFTSEDGVSYELQASDADEYSGNLGWTVAATVEAAGDSTTVTDDLSTDPLEGSFRFYRIKREEHWDYSKQTAGVFEITLTASPASKFISVPLIPDPDHNSVREVFGEKIGGVERRQVPSTGFQVSDLDEPTGAITRMRYQTPDPNVFTIIPEEGSEFDVEVGVAYEVLMAGLASRTLRFTGYVPEETLEVDIAKETSQSVRWMAYSMPRDITLNTLGLPGAVTAWPSGNRVRLLQLNASSWNTYGYDTSGKYWYDVDNSGVPVNPPITVGMGIEFVRADFITPTPPDKLPEVPWYGHPPNTW